MSNKFSRYLIISSGDLDSTCAMTVVMLALSNRYLLNTTQFMIDVDECETEYETIFLLGLEESAVHEIYSRQKNRIVWIHKTGVAEDSNLREVNGLRDSRFPVCLLTYAYMNVLSNFGTYQDDIDIFDPDTDFSTAYDYVKKIAEKVNNLS